MAGKVMPPCTFEGGEDGSSSDESEAEQDASCSDGSESSEESDASSVEENIDELREKLMEIGQLENVEKMADQVKAKLHEMGQLHKLKYFMEKRLVETGWSVQMLLKCREILLQNGGQATYNMMYEPIRYTGIRVVPAQVKQELLQSIKYCYECEANQN